MGVRGLWKVLAPTAKPVLLETLRGKILAIDASIWVYHFLKAMRDPNGVVMRAAHVIGFFRRICKLLFFEIKPIFVFDGAAPMLKKLTTSRRQERRQNREQTARATANRLLTLQLQRQREVEAAGATQIVGDIPEDALYLDDSSQQNGQGPVTASAGAGSSTRPFEKQDQYHLPDIEAVAPVRLNDQRMLTEEELDEYARQFTDQARTGFIDSALVDFHSPQFAQQPKTTQYQLLNAARLKSRLRMGYTADELTNMFSDQMEFSKFQIERVKQRNFFTQRLMDLAGLEDDLTRRVAGEKNKEYMLKRNEQGWTLSLGNRNNSEPPAAPPSQDQDLPIKKEPDTSPHKVQDSDSDDGFEDVDISALNTQAGMDKNESSDLTEETSKPTSLSDRDVEIDRLFGYEAGLQRRNIYDMLMDDETAHRQSNNISDEDTAAGDSLLFGRASAPAAIEEPKRPAFTNRPSRGEAASDSEKLQELQEPQEPQKPQDPMWFQTHGDFSKMVTKEDRSGLMTYEQGLRMVDEMSPDADSESDLEEVYVRTSDAAVAAMSHGEIEGTSLKSVLSAGSNREASVPSGNIHRNISQGSQTRPQSQVSWHERDLGEPHRPQTDRNTEVSISSKTNSSLDASSITRAKRLETGDLLNENKTSDFESEKSLAEETLEPKVEAQANARKHSKGKPSEVQAAEVQPSEIQAAVSQAVRRTSPMPKVQESEVEVQTSISQPDKVEPDENQTAQKASIESKTEESEADSGAGKSQIAEDQAKIITDAEAALSKEDEEADADEYQDIADILLGEAAENHRFAQRFTGGNRTNSDLDEYDRQVSQLRGQFAKQSRDADTVTGDMIEDCQALLQLFGIPYITAPTEAEAQCAELLDLKLVDGIVTDDGDSFLFGDVTVYRNIFSQSKYVECYSSSAISSDLGLDRQGLVELALLLGSDYTDGLPGIGPVSGVEILAEFGNLTDFKKWWDQAQKFPESVDTSTPQRRRLIKQFASKLFLSDDFPSKAVEDAYLHPVVDPDPTKFNWGSPDLEGLRRFMAASCGWSTERTNEVLLPVLQESKRRELQAKNAKGHSQTSLDDYYTTVRNLNLGSKRAAKATSELKRKRARKD